MKLSDSIIIRLLRAQKKETVLVTISCQDYSYNSVYIKKMRELPRIKPQLMHGVYGWKP